MTYAEQEYHALADEQELVWPAEGERAARRHQVEARGRDCESEATAFLLGESEQEVRAAHADHQYGARVLGPYVRREPGAKLRYWICWPLLWFGDTAGVWSAAVIHGEIVYIAFGQAFAAGLAAVCAGLVGSEFKDLRMARARQRDAESLSEDELRYRRLFTGPDDGLGIVKLIGLLSLVVVALLAVGIFTLRSGIEGNVAGLTFGLFAAATAIASGLLGYSAADEVADLLGTMAKRARRAEQRHLKLAAASPPRVRAEAEEAARSILAEYQFTWPGRREAGGFAGLAGAATQSAGGRARLSSRGARRDYRAAGTPGRCGMTRRGALLANTLLRSRLLRGSVGATSGRQVRPSGARYRLGDPGWPARVSTLLIAVFDNSGSVTSPTGTDPLSNRFAEVAHAFSVVARRGSSHELGAVLHFDTPSSAEVGPVPLTRRGFTALRAGLRVPPEGAGSSELAPSLRRAVAIADTHPGHETTLVVLSDFLLLDCDPGRVLAELAFFPGDVHAVVLDGRLAPGAFDDAITVTHVGWEDPPGAVARALFASLTTHRPGSHPSSAPP